MKRLVYPIISFVVLSCIQEQQTDLPAEQQLPESVKSEFYAKGDSDVKTMIQTDARGGNHVWWTAGDAIRIYDDIYAPGYKFDIVGDIEYGVPSATFVGCESKGATVFYAAYPSIDRSSCTDGVFEGLKIPSRQTSVFRSFDKSAFVCVTKADAKRNLKFENVCALFRIEVNTPAIKEVRITDPDGVADLAGTFSCTYTDQGKVILGEVTNSSSVLTLLPPDGRTYFPQGVYYISTLPEAFSAVRLTYVDDETGSTVEESVQGSLPLNMKSGMVVNLGTVKESNLLGKENWQIVYCNSEWQHDFGEHDYYGIDGDKFTGSANDLIDSDPMSLWNYYFLKPADQYANPDPYMPDYVPYYMVIDLGKAHNLSSIALTARQTLDVGYGVYNESSWYQQVARMTVEFSNDIIRRGMADVLDCGQSDWSGAEVFDESTLLNRKINKVDFSHTHSARYVRLKIGESYSYSTSLTPGYTGASIAEIDLYDANGNSIDKSGWKIVYVTSERSENYSKRGYVDKDNGSTWMGYAENAIDGDPLSMWVYGYEPDNASAVPTIKQYPYWVVIDFETRIQLNAFRLMGIADYDSMYAENYTTWQGGPARVTFEFADQITDRGMNDIFDPLYPTDWTIYSESFNEDKMLNRRVNELSFSQTVTARYVRMRVDMSYSDDNTETVPSRTWGSEIAELDFLLK